MSYTLSLPLILSFTLFACQNDAAILKNPKPKDLVGTWESLSIHQASPYAIIKFDPEGNGKFVFFEPSSEPEEPVSASFKTTSWGKTSFSILTTTDSEFMDEAKRFRGSIIEDQLCFEMQELELPMSIACFTRSSIIEKYKSSAVKALNQ